MLDDEKSDMKCLQSSRSTIVETWFLHYLQPELSSSYFLDLTKAKRTVHTFPSVPHTNT